MHKRSLVLLTALMIALCASPLRAGQPSGKHTVKKSKTAGKKKESATTKNSMNTSTSSDQTTITPGTSNTTGATSFDPNKGPRRPAPPKKKKP